MPFSTRTLNVKYFVDGDDGYVAEVNYEGEARFPDSYESASFESREYSPPRPVYTYDSNESKCNQPRFMEVIIFIMREVSFQEIIELLLKYCIGGSSEESFESYDSGETKYDFNCAVQHEDSVNAFGHEEARDGEHTQGSYYVKLPDTCLQNVKYFVDGDDGYVAEVNYEGEARFPDSYESASFESREYRPPSPVYIFESTESK
ncbi:uncharacterized protein LOC134777269 [Penaeus indicus]|uniref:uncharacterized protein LOC134777269 n=1 Tax=Penaeus indicus TaxID=29960 RepID=UPI00300C2D52